ncbi:MAG TPA: DUF1707 domain-containing protein [Streptosporangiaceae bacterium]|nr:DUF1707 domain-containing protein [Streptosporangiaceae bacterium]
MDTATNQYAPGDLRVSDADRDRALAELSEHFQAGRLTLEEFDERSGQALQARTARELTALFTDLPAAQSRTAGAIAVPEGRPRLPVPRAVVAVVAAVALAAVVTVVAGLARGGVTHHGFAVPVQVIVLLFLVRVFIFRRLIRSRSRRRGVIPDAPVQDR